MKTFLHYLKLLAALVLLLVLVAILLDLFIPARPYRKNEFEMLLAAAPLVLAADVWLFWWFIRGVRRRRAARRAGLRPVAPLKSRDPYHSRFYLKFKHIIMRFEGRSFNGFGTKYFTYADSHTDGSIMATRWLILGFFPIVPLYAQRMVPEGSTYRFRLFYSVDKTLVKVMGQEPLSKKLNRAVYLFYYLVFYPLIILPLVLLLVNIRALNDYFPGSSFWLLLLFYLAWGIFMIWISELFNKRFFLRTRP